jgi:outer membrane lipoprotein-sorting protein
MEIQNIGAGSRTVVDFTDIKYNVGLADDLFTQRALERGQ